MVLLWSASASKPRLLAYCQHINNLVLANPPFKVFNNMQKRIHFKKKKKKKTHTHLQSAEPSNPVDSLRKAKVCKLVPHPVSNPKPILTTEMP
jgi:hypothetical protein